MFNKQKKARIIAGFFALILAVSAALAFTAPAEKQTPADTNYVWVLYNCTAPGNPIITGVGNYFEDGLELSICPTPNTSLICARKFRRNDIPGVGLAQVNTSSGEAVFVNGAVPADRVDERFCFEE